MSQRVVGLAIFGLASLVATYAGSPETLIAAHSPPSQSLELEGRTAAKSG